MIQKALTTLAFAADTFVVVRTPFGWQIAAPVRHQFVDAEGALKHLQFGDADRTFLDSLAAMKAAGPPMARPTPAA